MRLLYLCTDHGIDPGGVKGASIHVRAITAALARAGHEVRLLSPKGDAGPDHAARPLLTRHGYDGEDTVRLLKHWLAERALGGGLARELRPLVYNASIFDAACAALKERPVDAVVERLSPFGHLGVDLATALDVPLLVEVNALLSDEARRFRSLELERLAETIEERVFERADAITVVSNALARQLEARGVLPAKVRVVPNGAMIEDFDTAPPREACRAALGLDGTFAVGFVGSLKPWHGTEVLLRAFERLLRDGADARLLIVGTGPQDAALHALADTAGIAHAVRFTGAVEHERIPALLRALDVAVAPYVPLDEFYFSPIKLFEYMASETCIVASRIGQIEEVLRHEHDALLCPPGDVDALHRALRFLCESPNLRRHLGVRARHTVRERFTWDHAAERTLAALGAAANTHTRAATLCDSAPERANAAGICAENR